MPNTFDFKPLKTALATLFESMAAKFHLLFGGLAIALAIGLQIGLVKITVLGLAIFIVLVVDLLNTGIELVVDVIVQQTYHELAKIAKDTSAAAVMITGLITLMIASLLLLPPLSRLVQAYF
jgi:diacylglycerol kinase (ATP)